MSAIRLRELGGRSSESNGAAPYVEQGPASLPESGVVQRTGYQAIRGIVDPLAAAILFVVFVPLFAVIWSAIRLSSPGPALFRQQRIGMGAKPFNMIKFRTMHVNAPSYSLKVAEYSPDITRVGRFLRRTGLDELPQLWNVIRGEMAIVGPRPEQIELR